MRRFFIFLIPLVLLFVFLKPTVIYAQDQPGISCGIAEGPNGADKCCSTTPQSAPGIPFQGALGKIPGFGGMIEQKEKADKQLIEIQKQNLTACLYGQPKSSGGSCTCKLSAAGAGANKEVADLCKLFITDPNERTFCTNCAHGGGFLTGLGCIPLNLQTFISNFAFSFGVGLATLVALLCIIYSAYILQTSQGNPERIKKAREYLTNCIIGLLLIIGSVLILRLIGISIFNIPFLR